MTHVHIIEGSADHDRPDDAHPDPFGILADLSTPDIAYVMTLVGARRQREARILQLRRECEDAIAAERGKCASLIRQADERYPGEGPGYLVEMAGSLINTLNAYDRSRAMAAAQARQAGGGADD